MVIQKVINIKTLKLEIKKAMVSNNINLFNLSIQSNISKLELLKILYVPFSIIKLTQYIAICKCLKIRCVF
jgi:hypothetical protein